MPKTKTTTEFLGAGDVTAPTTLVSRLKLPKAKKSPRTKAEKEQGGVIPRPVVTAMEHSPKEAVEVDSSWLVSWYFNLFLSRSFGEDGFKNVCQSQAPNLFLQVVF